MQHNLYIQFRQRLICRLLIDLNGFENGYCGRWTDHTAPLALLGISRSDVLDDEPPSVILKSIRAHYEMLKALDKNSLLPDNELVVWLCARFKLTKVELRILTVLSVISTDRSVLDAINEAAKINSRNMETVLAVLCECSDVMLNRCFSVNSKLVTSQLVSFNSECERLEARYAVQKLLPHSLLSAGGTKEDFLQTICRPIFASDITQDSFNYMADELSIVSELLKRKTAKATNILVYGEPGVGKSELVRLLCQITGKMGYEICFSSEESLQGNGKLERIALAQKLLDPNDSILLVDELEDIFPSSGISSESSRVGKRWFNSLLEEAKVPIVWVSNRIDQIDPAFIRRFQFCLHMDNPSAQYKLDMTPKKYNGFKKESWYSALFDNKALTPSDVKSAFASCDDLPKSLRVPSTFKTLVHNQLAARGIKPKAAQRKGYRWDTVYNPEMANASMNLDCISGAIEQTREGRYLLSGPPGTGKSGFVFYVSAINEIPIVRRTGADLLGSLVGESERAIKDMFEEASDKRAVLLIDEADTFVFQRTSLSKSWEISMVNEFLVQLERYHGVMFATTNRDEDMDPAILRRFDFNIRFDYLKPKQILQLFKDTLQLPNAEVPEDCVQLKNVTPADFGLAVRRSRILGVKINEDLLRNHLLEQARSRDKAPVQIGFIH